MLSILKLFKFLKKYTLLIVISLIILGVSVGANLIQPKLIEIAIDYGIGAKFKESIKTENIQNINANTIDNPLGEEENQSEINAKAIENTLDSLGLEYGTGEGNLNIVVLSGITIFVSALISALLSFLSGFFIIKGSQGMGYEIRNSLFKKVMSFSFSNLDKWRTGELMVRLNSDVNIVKMFIRMGFFMIVMSVMMIIGSVYMMFVTNAELGKIMLIIMPCILLLFFVFATWIRPMFMTQRKKLDNMNNRLQENLSGAKVVRAFSRQAHEVSVFKEKNEDYLKISLKVGYIVSILFPFLFFVANITLLISLWVGGNTVIAGGLKLGELVAFTNYALMATFPVLMLGMVLTFLSTASASADRINKVFKEKSNIKEVENPIVKDKLNGDIEFRNVSFHYGDGDNAVDSFNLHIKKGERIGILGTTGSGKSSFANLIPRLYEPQEGEILIDGVDIKKYSLSFLRRHIGMVLQETFIFSGTIRSNLIFGNPDADEELINDAVEIASAKEFIMEKENKFDEHVGERGSGLSGGQRQRVAIARAIISNPDIFIFDDVTSSVDAETEQKIYSRLYERLQKKTMIIISQKISTLQNTDRIVVLDRGRIAGVGAHGELMKESKIYKEIFDTQNSNL